MKSITFQGILSAPNAHWSAAAATMSLATTTVIAAAFQGAALTEQSHLIASIGKSVLRLDHDLRCSHCAVFHPVPRIAPHTGSVSREHLRKPEKIPER